MKWCSSASSAVRVRRGSTTTTLPPRSRIARSRPRMSGAVIRLPFDASGFAPRISRWSVRSMSGTGTDSAVPNIRPDGDLLRHLVDGARGREHVPRAERAEQHPRVERQRAGCGRSGCRGRRRRRSAPCAAAIGGSRSAITANASSQLAGTSSPPRRTSGVREPVGILVERRDARPLGADEAVREHVLVVAPAPSRTRPSSSVSSRPQLASHSGQVRMRSAWRSAPAPVRVSAAEVLEVRAMAPEPTGLSGPPAPGRRVDLPRVTFYPLWRWLPPRSPCPPFVPPPSAPRASSRRPPARSKTRRWMRSPSR